MSLTSPVCAFMTIFYVLRLFLLYLIYFMSLDNIYFLDDESNDYGSDSVSTGTCAFTLNFDNYVGRVSGVGSGVFVPIVVEYNCDTITFLCLYK